MARKPPPEEQPKGAPEWIVTFSDMISLLVTFFVMLMSFSTISSKEQMTIIEAFQNSRGGIMLNLWGPDAIAPPPIDRLSGVHTMRGARQPHVRPDEELLRTLEEMGQREDEQHVPVDFAKALDGLRIAFDPSAAFAPGSAEVPPELAKSLGEIARVLEGYVHLIVIEGFTDGAFQPSARYPSAEALSAARAAAAARSMLEQSALSPDTIQVSGLGAARPRADDSTALGRSENRRVELRVLSLSKARAALIERQRKEWRERER